jgi:hypothetical protein
VAHEVENIYYSPFVENVHHPQSTRLSKIKFRVGESAKIPSNFVFWSQQLQFLCRATEKFKI